MICQLQRFSNRQTYYQTPEFKGTPFAKPLVLIRARELGQGTGVVSLIQAVSR
jgi:hypothetical protein